MALVTLDEIEQATSRIAVTCLRTPVLPVAVDTARAGTSSLWIKAEGLQPTGAFKLRGATNAIAQLGAKQRAAGVVTHSSGNHAQAVAFAAAAVGASATVVMPENASTSKVEATRSLGAEVVIVPASQRVAACYEIAARTGAEIIPPYDDARVIAGQGTIGLEILEQVPDLAVVLVPLGGGGLISGVATAVKLSRSGITVIGVEPALAGDAAESFAAGERRTWSVDDTARTMADGLRTPAVGELNWDHILAYVDDVVTVSEEAIAAAVRELVTRTRTVVEPSGAVAAAAYLERPDAIPAGITVAIASGGNVEPAVLAAALA